MLKYSQTYSFEARSRQNRATALYSPNHCRLADMIGAYVASFAAVMVALAVYTKLVIKPVLDRYA